jgi:hypothetical protein
MTMNGTKLPLIDQVRSARRVSTPLLGIITQDPEATVAQVCKGTKKDAPKVRWDCARGLTALNPQGQGALATMIGNMPAEQFTDPVGVMKSALRLPERSILFMDSLDQFIAAPLVMQSVRNLRNPFKTDGRTMIALAAELMLPPSLRHDVLVIEEELPGDDQLRSIVTGLAHEADVELTVDQADKAVDATRGLSAFAAEQVDAMSLTKEGIDLAQLWERKRGMIAHTPGLSMMLGGPTFKDVGGLKEIQAFMHAYQKGPKPGRVIVWMDEIDKAMAGASGKVQDSSGVSQDIHGQLLTSMEDNHWTGIIAVGPRGCAKSLLARTAGAELNIPTLRFDVGGLKGMYVGQSEQNVRGVVRVIRAVAGEDAFFIATCNDIDALSTPLRRRFKLGTYYFDLPTKDEKPSIWGIHMTAFGLDIKQEMPDDEGWSGANIQACCEIAYKTRVSLTVAARKIIPVAKEDPEELQKLRERANGRYLSVAREGFYELDGAVAPAVTSKRKINVK